mmetsp:Transcript_26561/g.106350  ORF Transcript_26561/g.106350 Transcript_26561/m.106350 type:complete len:272 (-) Transcript_26561:1056-1871(-)
MRALLLDLLLLRLLGTPPDVVRGLRALSLVVVVVVVEEGGSAEDLERAAVGVGCGGRPRRLRGRQRCGVARGRRRLARRAELEVGRRQPARLARARHRGGRRDAHEAAPIFIVTRALSSSSSGRSRLQHPARLDAGVEDLEVRPERRGHEVGRRRRRQEVRKGLGAARTIVAEAHAHVDDERAVAPREELGLRAVDAGRARDRPPERLALRGVEVGDARVGHAQRRVDAPLLLRRLVVGGVGGGVITIGIVVDDAAAERRRGRRRRRRLDR